MPFPDAHAYRFALDRLSHPLLIVDETLEIRFANTAAERVLSAGDGVMRRRNRLSLASAVAQRHLRSVTRARADRGSAPGELTFEVPRRSTDAPLFLNAVRAADRAGTGGAMHILITLHEAEPCDPAHAEARFRRLGLTAAEARVAALAAQARPVRGIAAEIGVSANTVKSHLKAVYGKLGVSSRAALAHLVASL